MRIALVVLAFFAAPVIAGPVSKVRADFLLNCAGCHGVSGDAGQANVPRLIGTGGNLLCTAESRAYAVRLPNVALARNLTDERLAALMNFVVFDLGGATHERPYSPPEVAALRAKPLVAGNLREERARIWKDIMRTCRPGTVKVVLNSGAE